MTQQRTSELRLRDYPDDDALLNPGKYSKALSFSPDIIPLYGKTADEGTLCHPASWRGFSGLPIVGGDVNNVYIRGHGSGGPHVASLRAVPSELILWPHVWHDEPPVPSGPVVIPAGDKKGPYVSDGPLHFRPEHCTGYTHSLIAHVYKHDESIKGMTPPPFDLEKGGVDDFLSFLEKDKTHTFYNVIVADPTLKHVSATTRLRMIGKTPQSIGFRVVPHAGSPLPAGLEVSLVDDRGKINIPRTPLEHFGDKTFLLEPSYNGTLMFNAFAPDGHGVYEPYSGLSLQAFKGEASQQGGLSLLLGALNIIFEHHGTRNLRFASQAAHLLRDASFKANAKSSTTTTRGEYDPIPVTTPAATGWWTRASTADTNNFPHHDPIGYSPDIQPVGTDLGSQNFLTVLQDPADYSSAHQVKLTGNQKNYFFVRGFSTLVDIDVQARLFAVNASTVNYPTQYVREGLKAGVLGIPGEVNSTRISVKSPNQFYVFEKPFVISNPPDDSNHHYCLIAEFRQKRKGAPEYPGWPSDNWTEYKTLADFENMVFASPLVCWRNIDWQPCPPGGKCWEWACTTELCIPEVSSLSSFWTMTLECENRVIPDGSKWNLVCDDNKVFPKGICFDNTPLSADHCVTGCHFTGAPPGYKAKLTVTVTWCDNEDHDIPPPCIRWKLALTEPHVSPIKHLAHEPAEGHGEWPFHVTEHYPHIGERPNPSPLPWFEAPGLNRWPHEGTTHFPLGQVRIGAIRE